MHLGLVVFVSWSRGGGFSRYTCLFNRSRRLDVSAIICFRALTCRRLLLTVQTEETGSLKIIWCQYCSYRSWLVYAGHVNVWKKGRPVLTTYMHWCRSGWCAQIDIPAGSPFAGQFILPSGSSPVSLGDSVVSNILSGSEDHAFVFEMALQLNSEFGRRRIHRVFGTFLWKGCGSISKYDFAVPFRRIGEALAPGPITKDMVVDEFSFLTFNPAQIMRLESDICHWPIGVWDASVTSHTERALPFVRNISQQVSQRWGSERVEP